MCSLNFGTKKKNANESLFLSELARINVIKIENENKHTKSITNFFLKTKMQWSRICKRILARIKAHYLPFLQTAENLTMSIELLTFRLCGQKMLLKLVSHLKS